MIIGRTYTRTITIAATLVVAAGLAVGSWMYLQQTSKAADMSRFDPGNIMSDAVMSNKDTMTVQQIQSFLDSKNACNNTNTYMASWYPNLQYNIRDGKFVCMAQESFGGKSAAQIIWQAGQDYGINPQFLIVLLEKEQGLITDTWPNNIQYRSATGFGCPDTAACDSKYFGLENQVRQAANLFRNVLNGGWSNYPVGLTYVQYHPNASCGGKVINIQNRATSALYRYTPYQPNASALAAGYALGDSCGAYGNRNTWRLFTDWFGSTHHKGDIYIQKKYNDLIKSGISIGEPTSLAQVTTNNGLYRLYENGVIYWNESTGAYSVLSGPSRDKYRQYGLEKGDMGYPSSDQINTLDGGSYQLFQRAVIYKGPLTDYQVVFSGYFRDKYRSSGLESGVLGYPTTDRICGIKNNGCYQGFENGTIYHSQKIGTYSVVGGNRDYYRKNGLEDGLLGMPVSDQILGIKDGYSYQLFEGAVVYSNAVNTVSVLNGITRDTYRKSGLENGSLGFPTEDILQGVQKFQNGSIVNGHILSSESHKLFTTSETMGTPLSSIACTLERNGCFQVFSGGIFYESTNGAFLIPNGEVLDKFRALGRESGAGYPISQVAQGSQKFEKTTIYYTQSFD